MDIEKTLDSIYSINAIHKILGIGLATYMKAINVLGKFEVLGEQNHLDAKQSGDSILYLIWHQQQMPFISFSWTGLELEKLLVLVEGADRGGILIHAANSIGADEPVPVEMGGNSMTGARNLLSLIRKMKTGKNIMIMPDGPYGPPFEAKKGAVFVAKKTQGLILPCGSWMSHGITLNRWDKYIIPLPFTKMTVAFGKPFKYETGMDDDQVLLKIEQSLSEVRETAIGYFE